MSPPEKRLREILKNVFSPVYVLKSALHFNERRNNSKINITLPGAAAGTLAQACARLRFLNLKKCCQ